MAKSPSLYSINPFTKRKTKKCSPSHERYVNPQKKTFRCLVKCKKGQTRNPKTRRCNYTKNEKQMSKCSKSRGKLLGQSTTMEQVKQTKQTI